MAVFALEHVSLAFDHHALLDDAVLQVEPGERLALVGRNGMCEARSARREVLGQASFGIAGGNQSGQMTDVVQHGKTAESTQRFFCQNLASPRQTLLLQSVYRWLLQDVKEPRVGLAMQGRGIRATARGLPVSPPTVRET